MHKIERHRNEIERLSAEFSILCYSFNTDEMSFCENGETQNCINPKFLDPIIKQIDQENPSLVIINTHGNSSSSIKSKINIEKSRRFHREYIPSQLPARYNILDIDNDKTENHISVFYSDSASNKISSERSFFTLQTFSESMEKDIALNIPYSCVAVNHVKNGTIIFICVDFSKLHNSDIEYKVMEDSLMLNNIISNASAKFEPNYVFIMGTFNFMINTSNIEVPTDDINFLVKAIMENPTPESIQALKVYDTVNYTKQIAPFSFLAEGVDQEGVAFSGTWKMAKGRDKSCQDLGERYKKIPTNCFDSSDMKFGWFNRIFYTSGEQKSIASIDKNKVKARLFCTDYGRIDVHELSQLTHAGIYGKYIFAPENSSIFKEPRKPILTYENAKKALIIAAKVLVAGAVVGAAAYGAYQGYQHLTGAAGIPSNLDRNNTEQLEGMKEDYLRKGNIEAVAKIDEAIIKNIQRDLDLDTVNKIKSLNTNPRNALETAINNMNLDTPLGEVARAKIAELESEGSPYIKRIIAERLALKTKLVLDQALRDDEAFNGNMTMIDKSLEVQRLENLYEQQKSLADNLKKESDIFIKKADFSTPLEENIQQNVIKTFSRSDAVKHGAEMELKNLTNKNPEAGILVERYKYKTLDKKLNIYKDQLNDLVRNKNINPVEYKVRTDYLNYTIGQISAMKSNVYETLDPIAKQVISERGEIPDVLLTAGEVRAELNNPGLTDYTSLAIKGKIVEANRKIANLKFSPGERAQAQKDLEFLRNQYIKYDKNKTN